MAAAAWLGPGVGQPKLWWGHKSSFFCACAPGFKLAGNMGLYIENAGFSINQKMSPGKFAKTQQMRMPTMYH